MFPRQNKDGSVTWTTKINRFDSKTGKLVPRQVALGKNKTRAQKLEHELKEQERRAGLGLEGAGSRVFLGTFAELCRAAHENYFKGRRGEQEDVSRLNRYGGAGIGPRKGAKATSNTGDGWTSPLGSMLARDLRPEDFNKLFRDLETRITRRGTPLTGKAINRVRETLCKVFIVAAEHGLWPEGDNPPRRSMKRDELEASWDVLRPEELGAVLAEIPDYWLGCCVVALTAALRKGELFGLLKNDVDVAKQVFYIWRSHGHDITKGGDGRREAVAMHPSALPFVEQWMKSPGPYLFPDPKGERRKESYPTENIFRAAMVRAGIVERYDHVCRRKGCCHRESHQDPEQRRCPAPMPGDPNRVCGYKLWPVGVPRPIKFHAARHTAATAMLRDGVPLAIVQKMLRHKDPGLTMRMYGHLMPGDMVDHVAKMSFPRLVASGDSGTLGVPEGDNRSTGVEPSPQLRIAGGGGAANLGAYRVRGVGGASVDSSADLESGMFLGGWSVEPRGIEPLTYALRTRLGEALPTVTACQPVAITGISEAAPSTGSHPFAPVFLGSGAYRVRGAQLAHPRPEECIGVGSPPSAAEQPAATLLTVRQVAARLHLSTARVYGLVESGDLGHVRLGSNTIRVSEADLAGYIARCVGGGK
jgi:excisionase family DNA binding protein